MKISKIKIGNKVYDRWYQDWGTGKIVKVLKTRIKIKFDNHEEIMTYDFPHAELFLKKKG